MLFKTNLVFGNYTSIYGTYFYGEPAHYPSSQKNIVIEAANRNPIVQQRSKISHLSRFETRFMYVHIVHQFRVSRCPNDEGKEDASSCKKHKRLPYLFRKLQSRRLTKLSSRTQFTISLQRLYKTLFGQFSKCSCYMSLLQITCNQYFVVLKICKSVVSRASVLLTGDYIFAIIIVQLIHFREVKRLLID